MNEEIRKKLNEILTNGSIEDNMDFILENIPEIKPMIGFEHNHPYHYLDIWQHTLEAKRQLNSNDLEENMSILLHDIGKPESCVDYGYIRHYRGHPEISRRITEEILTRLGYDDKFVENVCYLVGMHDAVIDPDNLDNSKEMIKKRINIQYADTKAHNLEKVAKRLEYLDEISQKIYGDERE